jgi:hypothetical protein
MGFQPEYGLRLIRERYVDTGETIPYYRIIQQSTTETKVKLGTVGCRPIAVSIPSEEAFMPNGSGGIIPRTGYVAGEIPEAQMTGIAFVELAETVTQGELCGSSANGRGIAVDLSLSSQNTELSKVAGAFLEGGDAGDIVRIDLDRRQ